MNDKMYRLYIILWFLLVQFQVFGSHKVFIIHGYGSTKFMMNKLTKSIKNENFSTENYGYKSMSEDLDSLGKQLYYKIKSEKLDTVSFVTHSMGGLVFRSMLQYALIDNEFPVVFRIVMIAPPNSGAEIADFGSSIQILKKILGPNVSHMKTDSGSYAKRLPIPYNSEVGIIAGIRGKERGYNLFIKGDNDGLLTPERTKLGIEKDFIEIKGEHNFLIQKKYVCQLTVVFLKFGSFKLR